MGDPLINKQLKTLLSILENAPVGTGLGGTMVKTTGSVTETAQPTNHNHASQVKMVKKVNKNQKLLKPAEILNQDDTCDAILVTRSDLGEEEEMKKNAKDALEKALDEDELHVEDVKGDFFVGNRRGLRLAGLPTLVDALNNEVTSHKTKIASLEDRVGSLTSSLDAYKLLRNRFISTFKRDKLRNPDDADRKIIGAGNAWAHGGDAVVDAQLYQIGGRNDPTVFEKLYGIDPLRVLRITHKETIDVLNTHAGVAASNHKVGSEMFYMLFANFVKLFKESGRGYEDGYLDGNPTDVTRAYWEFMHCIKDEVTRVEAAEASD